MTAKSLIISRKRQVDGYIALRQDCPKSGYLATYFLRMRRVLQPNTRNSLYIAMIRYLCKLHHVQILGT